MQALQNDLERFAELSAQVLGVSPDTLTTHTEFAQKHGLGFALIADAGTIRKLYGGGRVTYLVDQAGVIRYLHKGMPDNVRLVEEVARLAR